MIPYEFSPTVALCCGGALALYVRGLLRGASDVSVARGLAFVLGVVSMYVVLQTRFDYLSQHMFFIHRIQHLVLHHVGPFLVALAAPQAVLAAGLPERVRAPLVRAWRSRLVQWPYRTLQQPVIATLLFVGLIYLWLIPQIHFYAMLNADLYNAMNWSMAVDGLLFWWLMLNPSTRGPATLAYGGRMVVLFLAMWPQIAIGAYIALSERELFDVYAVCGRIWPVGPLVDQQIGGLITWIPPAMMSVLGMLVVLRLWLHADQARADRSGGPAPSAELGGV